MINVDEKFYIRVKAFVGGEWVVLASAPADVDKGKLDGQDPNAVLENQLDKFNHTVNFAYKEDAPAYIQIGSTSINVARFDALQFCYVQNGAEINYQN